MKKVVYNMKICLKAISAALCSFFLVNSLCMFYYSAPGDLYRNNGTTRSIRKPQSYYVNAAEGFGIIRFDKNGYNNMDCELEKPYVLVMGSSHMEATYVNQQQNTSTILNDLLGGTGKDLRTYNIAHANNPLPDIIKGFQAGIGEFPDSCAVIMEIYDTTFSISDLQNSLQQTIYSADSGGAYLSQHLTADQKLRSSVIGWLPYAKYVLKRQLALIQLEQNHSIRIQNMIQGAQIFLVGLVKKVVMANRLGRAVDAVYAAPEIYSGISILLTTFAYTMQIYFDFSGYSDMAVGIAKSLGYDLGKNFNMPYISRNPSEFWRRWHISLSGWFREYVYIPLGGSRGSLLRTCINLFLVMLLSGVWHGSRLTFILWGIYHGVGVVVHRLFVEVIHKKGWEIKSVSGKRIARGISVLCTLIFVNIGWILFRADTLDTVWVMLYRIFTLADGVQYIYVFTLIFGIIFLIVNCYIFIKKEGNAEYIFLDYNNYSAWVILWTVIFLTLMFFYSGETEFIYGRF